MERVLQSRREVAVICRTLWECALYVMRGQQCSEQTVTVIVEQVSDSAIKLFLLKFVSQFLYSGILFLHFPFKALVDRLWKAVGVCDAIRSVVVVFFVRQSEAHQVFSVC